MKKNTQLTCKQRYHIYLLNKQECDQTFIAKSMNVDKSTISGELSCNTGKRGYRHKQTNRLASERHQQKNKVAGGELYNTYATNTKDTINAIVRIITEV